ncbi:MAG: rhodanese-like domain-containing protein [Bacteroidales bacterium]|nr:rhodanese-like domain-containing protein [Bacteroidales bacterium]
MMKRLGLAVVLGVLLISCANNAQQNNVEQQMSAAPVIGNLNVEQFGELIKDTTVVLLDVRTPQEFAQGCIEGALNIDVKDSLFIKNVQAAIPAGAKVAVYCRSGRRSMMAAEQMLEKGYVPVNLDGGILAWQEAAK